MTEWDGRTRFPIEFDEDQIRELSEGVVAEDVRTLCRGLLATQAQYTFVLEADPRSVADPPSPVAPRRPLHRVRKPARSGVQTLPALSD